MFIDLKPKCGGFTSSEETEVVVERKRKRCIVHDFAVPKLVRKLRVGKQRAEDT